MYSLLFMQTQGSLANCSAMNLLFPFLIFKQERLKEKWFPSCNTYISLCSALCPTEDILSPLPFVFIIDSMILLIFYQIYNPDITSRWKLIFKYLVSQLCLNFAGDFCLLLRGSDLSCLLTHQKAWQIQALQYWKKSENYYFLSDSLSVIPVTLRSTAHWSWPHCTRNCVKLQRRTGSQEALQSKYMRQYSGGYKQADRKMQRINKSLLISTSSTPAA